MSKTVVSNTNLATAPANSVKANTSGSTAQPTDLVIGALQFLGNTGTSSLTAVTLSASGGLAINSSSNRVAIDGNYLLTLINTLSTNMNKIGNYPYLEYAWVTAPNVAGQAITANTITTLTMDTEVSDTGSYGSIGSNQVTLAAGTYSYEAYTGWDFNGGGGGSMAGFGLYNITSSSYVSRTGPTAVRSAGFYSLKLNGQFTINTTTVFDIRGWSNTNFKVHNSDGDTSITLSTASADQRTTLKLWKVG